ncbi:uncharacterized protein LOC123314040 [Coccinella septempunctata]|uniref:uncharacterized protein LOC123314040 n=1 Tax=Coccinella septempunctata TaxID=41139 RepID=UPI001D080B07|nr:uncharacterized protein LOC123314040 [Coccinella septempunctata]
MAQLYNLTAICLTEHWKEYEQLKNHNIEGFCIASAYCRSVYKHGGSAIYIKEGIQYQERRDLVKLSIEKILEISSIDVKIDHDTAQIITINEQMQQGQKCQYRRIITPNHMQILADSLKLQDWSILYLRMK